MSTGRNGVQVLHYKPKTLGTPCPSMDPETKQLPQFPCAIRVITNEVQNKAKTQNWKVHHCDVTQAVDAVTKAAWEKFEPWVQGLQATPEKAATFQEWMDGLDRPMTDEHRAALRKAASL